MRVHRVGEKLISEDKILQTVARVLEMRSAGASQQEVAAKLHLERSFVSRLEGIGELRKGKKIGLVAFPVGNKAEVAELAQKYGVDYSLILTDEERWRFVEETSGLELLNRVMAIIARMRECDVVIMIGSDMRIRLVQAIVGDNEVVGISLGPSPITGDRTVDIEQLDQILEGIKSAGGERGDQS